jgi:hypothetical protein
MAGLVKETRDRQLDYATLLGGLLSPPTGGPSSLNTATTCSAAACISSAWRRANAGRWPMPLFIDVEDRCYFAQSSAGVSLILGTIEQPTSKPSWFHDAITKIQHQVVALDPKVKEIKNPWMAAAITESKPYLSVLAESAPVFGVGAAQANPDVIAGSRSGGGFVKEKPGAGFVMYVEPSFRFASVPGLNLDVKPFHHPFADRFAEVLRRDGLPALLTPETQRSPVPAEQTFAGLTKPVAGRVTAPAGGLLVGFIPPGLEERGRLLARRPACAVLAPPTTAPTPPRPQARTASSST